MNCKKCGELLPEGTKFCTKCGANQTLVEEEIIEKEDLNHTRILRREERKSLEDTTEMHPIETEDPVYEVDPYETKKDTSEVLRIKRRPKEEIKEKKVKQEKPAFVFPWKREKKSEDLNSKKFIKEEKVKNPYVQDSYEEPYNEEEPSIQYYPEHDVPKPSAARGFLSLPLYLLFIGQLAFIFILLPYMSYTGGNQTLSLAITAFIMIAVLIIHQLCYSKASKKTGVFLGKDRRHILRSFLINFMLLPFSGTLGAIYYVAIYNRQTAIIIFAVLFAVVLILIKPLIMAILKEVIYDRGILKKFARKYRGRFILLFIVLPMIVVLAFGTFGMNGLIPFNIF